MANKTESHKDDEAPRDGIPADEARQRLGELIDRAGFLGERIIITRHGRPIVALIGMGDLAVVEAANAAA